MDFIKTEIFCSSKALWREWRGKLQIRRRYLQYIYSEKKLDTDNKHLKRCSSLIITEKKNKATTHLLEYLKLKNLTNTKGVGGTIEKQGLSHIAGGSVKC